MDDRTMYMCMEIISTNRFYAEKPMGGFYRLTDTCVISSAIGMDKIACQSFVTTRQ